MAVGIIAEYNPFHNGHIYQLKEAQKRFPGEEIIVILSEKYVQRGEIAVASFEERKKMALEYGATKVVPLPFEYSTQAAHIFASGAVKIANDNGVDKLFFGSESDDPKTLMLIANTIYKREDEYNKILKTKLKEGLSFPKANALTLEELIGQSIVMPNDILGLEYCKSIVLNKYNIATHTLKRTVGFHSDEINNSFASATKLREMIYKGESIEKYSPMKITLPIERIEDYYGEFQKKVRESTPEELREITLISEGMENLFKKHIEMPTYNEFVNATNSKRYTSSRIKRVMLYVLLGIKKNNNSFKD